MIIQVSSTGLYLDFIRFTFSIHFRLTICKVKNFLLKYFFYALFLYRFSTVFNRVMNILCYLCNLKISVCTGMKGDSMKKRRFTQISAKFNL